LKDPLKETNSNVSSSASNTVRSVEICGNGLPNLGKTCFMNASLQLLMNNKTFSQILKLKLKKNARETDAKFAERENLQRCLHTLNSLYHSENPNRSDIASNLKTIMSLSIFKQFSWKIKEEDASEFLYKVYEYLEADEFSEVSVSLQDINSNDNGRGGLVGPAQKTQLLPIEFLTKDETGDVSLQLLINNLFSKDTHKQTTVRIEHLDVSYLRNVNFHFKRFDVKSSDKETYKINQSIKGILDPCNIAVYEEITGNSINVQLRANSVICHLGTFETGHYVTIVRIGDEFVLKNDSTETKISLQYAQKIAEEMGYIVNFDVIVL
jgi:ubiquitin C-terminal hydrolase